MRNIAIAVVALMVVAVAALMLVPIKYLPSVDASFAVVGVIVVALVWVACGAVTQTILVPRGYGNVAAFCVGMLLGPIGVVVALVMAGTGDRGDTSTEVDNAMALREYKALMDEGAITRDEFDTKKRELLG